MSSSGIKNMATRFHAFNRVALFLIFFLVTSTESDTGEYFSISVSILVWTSCGLIMKYVQIPIAIVNFFPGFNDPMMRLNTGLHDEPELDPSTNFSQKSLPSIRTDLSPNVVGVLRKEVRLACYLNNLGNKTV